MNNYEKMMNIVYSFQKDYFFLSNFFNHDLIFYNDMAATNVETLYQASKPLFKVDSEKILKTSSPGEAKKLGRRGELSHDWEKRKVSIMYDLLTLKFKIPELRNKLISTAGMVLIEGNYWQDRFWGVCEGEGLNILGEMLMEIRRLITHEKLIIFDRKEIYGRVDIRKFV